ncbi:hypothetical protein Ga0100231_023855 [Opitutaceae bacterium TAV4]|nr:hypothetical protein Ga0100231_023855 [Opitutaceae bacterium TAV4]RRK00747.1 hypothetical protein Ga0100230_023430 [Opitutaceae bacterium TAV3]
MKVIAIVKDDGRGYRSEQTLLIEIKGEELAHLIGISGYDDVPGVTRKTFRVGDTLRVSNLYETMLALKHDKEVLAKMVHKLKSVAGALENLPEVFRAVGEVPAENANGGAS